MKFIIERSVYNALLNKVKKNLFSSNDENAMKYIVHELTSDGLKLIATNFKSRSEFFLPVGKYIQIIEPGTSCILGQKLSELVSVFSDGEICIHTEKSNNSENACISKTNNKNKNVHWIPCCDISIYPINEFVLTNNNVRRCKFNAQVFKSILKNVEFATSNDENSDISLSNVELNVGEEEITACGVSFEMISYSIIKRSSIDIEGTGLFYIMNVAIKDFIGLLDDLNEVEIFTDDKLLVVKQLNFIYCFRMLEASFPNWREKILIQNDFNLVVSKEQIVNSLKQIKIISPVCRFCIMNNEIKINSINCDDLSSAIGSGECAIECVANGDGSFIVVIELIMEVINRVSSEDVIFRYSNNPNLPISILINEETSAIVGTVRE